MYGKFLKFSKQLLLGRSLDDCFCSTDLLTLRIVSMKSLAIGGFYSSQNKTKINPDNKPGIG